MFDFLKKRYNTPVETRSYGKIYLIFSFILFIATMYSIIDEVTVRRPWKDYQNEYKKISIEKFTQKLNDAIAMFDSIGYKETLANINEVFKKQQSKEYVAIIEEIKNIKEELVDVSREFTFAKSLGDETYYFYQTAKKENHNVEDVEKKLREYETKQKEFGKIVSQLELKRDSLLKIQTEIDLEVKNAQSKLNIFFEEINKWNAKIELANKSSLEIKQVILNDFERTNFGTVKARIDRCQTCHLGYREFETMSDAPQPFTAHPFPELIEKHNPEIIGCTTCHNGQGPALTKGFAHSKHGDKEGDHYWESPLLEKEETYASCQTCHANDFVLKDAKRFNEGRHLVMESGCFGCHEMKGFTGIKKIGPEINQLSAKTNTEWIFRWIRNPKDYNPHSRMPNFKFSDEEAEAITAYLWKVSNDSLYKIEDENFSGGNIEKGKQIVSEVGCKACHVVEGDERVRQLRGKSYDIAPELTRIGSKTNAKWLYEWIRNPKKYRPNTTMPSLRLTDSEAKDVVAYLMTLNDERKFENKTLDLVSESKIKKGENLIREYGCNGCHEIRGIEKEGKVSVSLSNFGRKRVEELDFGDLKLSHNEQSWDKWVFGKLKTSRQYTTERIISKMPVFSFADSEIVVIRTLLRGMRKDTAEAKWSHQNTRKVQMTQIGRKITSNYHCQNCHLLEESGGYVSALFEDAGMAPPPITPEGAKVQEMWFYNFLKSPTPIRPWLKLRMPTFHFSDAEIDSLYKYFISLSNQEITLRNYHTFEIENSTVSIGKTLFDANMCLSCHYTGTIPQGKEMADLAPNLELAKNRLKPEWIVEWLKNPEAIQPGTRMPQFFPHDDFGNPTATYTEYLNGDAIKQMEAIRNYIWTLGKNK